MKEHYTSIDLSRFLEEKGFHKEVKLWHCFKWADASHSYEGEEYELTENPEGRGQTPAYDLLWDICILHGKELFGEDGEVGEYCRKPEVDGKHCDDWDCSREEWHQGVETVTHIIFNLLMEGEKDKAEEEIKLNCIL